MSVYTKSRISKLVASLIAILILMILCTSCADRDKTENIKYVMPPHFTFNGREYGLYFEKERGVYGGNCVDVNLDELPERYSCHGVIGPENKSEYDESVEETGVAGLDYYYDSEDLSIIYVYTKVREVTQDGSVLNYYKYIPYAPTK